MDKEVLYVSLKGSDSFSGRYPERKGNDGPFLTLQRALDEILNIKKKNKGILKRQILILIRGGTYFLNSPIEIKPLHSGTPNFPVVIMAYNGEKVKLSAGEKLKNFKEEKIDGKKLLTCKMENKIRNLWLNGKRVYRARFPRNGYLKVAGICKEDEKNEWNEGVYRFKFNKGDIKRWNSFKNGEIILLAKWVDSRLPILSINEEKRIVEFSKRTAHKPIKNDLYYIENIFELINRNQWYFDYENGTLYFYPEEGTRKFNFIAPKFENVLKVVGCPEENKYVEYIHFHNISFSHTEWYIPEKSLRGKDVGGFMQASIEVPGAIYCEGMKNCKFEDCEINDIGTYGIELGKGCQNNKIIKCKIHDIGAGGIKIGENIIRDEENLQTFGNEIDGCIIKNGGQIFHDSVGIWIGQSYGNKVLNNEICDFYYTGISIGWTWGYGKSLANNNIVRFNYIHNIGKKKNGDGPILSDMGAIYTLGIQEGTLISNNLLCDIYGYWYGGWGIYLDEGSSFIVAENNLVYNTTHGGFHQHYGKENIIRNNIFAFGKEQQIQISKPEPHKRLIFQHNIVVGDTEKWIEGGLDFNFLFDKNLYWNRKNKKIKFIDTGGNKYTWEEWVEKGMDKNSVIADPLFYNVEKLDFRMKKNSPAFKLGFRRFLLPKKKL